MERDENPLFVDVEASSLKYGFPVEIGWARLVTTNGGPGYIQSGSMLIKPCSRWLDPSDFAWSHEAEAIHGISREEACRDGLPVLRVAEAINEIAAGATAWVDTLSFDYDYAWIECLFRAAGIERKFRIKYLGSLYRQYWDDDDHPAVMAATQAANSQEPAHRAEPDAIQMAFAFRMALERHAVSAPPP